MINVELIAIFPLAGVVEGVIVAVLPDPETDHILLLRRLDSFLSVVTPKLPHKANSDVDVIFPLIVYFSDCIFSSCSDNVLTASIKTPIMFP